MLNGKIAFVTGAAQGIGQAIARRLARDGARVVLADMKLAAAEAAAAAIRADGGDAEAAELNVAISDSVRAVGAQLGRVDILVNNAGITRDTPLLETSEADWRRVFDVNLFGPIHCIQTFAPGMVAAGWGRIINMASLLSFTAFGRDLGYATTKTGLLGLTRSASAELIKKGITVNAICPGNVMTEMMQELAPRLEARDGLEPGSFLAMRARQIPLGRLAEPSEVASLASFLCSDDAAYITGQAMHVNGGLYYH